MKDWSCCNPAGKCERGPGCPAGGACHSMPGCADTHCPGHPGGAKVAKVKRRYPAKSPLMANASRIYIKRLARAMLLFLAVSVLCSLAVSMIPRIPPKTDCAKLLSQWNGNPPAYLAIKCKNENKA